MNWFRRLCGVTPRKIVFKNKEFKKYLADVASCSTFRTTHQYVQHGNTSVLLHSIAVAYYSYYLSWYFHLNFRERELVRGALLHDYFLYDWHNSGEGHTFHAFTHARDAFVNAQKEFELSRIEREVIKKHMFPLTPVPPLCREGLMVCLVDKAVPCTKPLNKIHTLCSEKSFCPRCLSLSLWMIFRLTVDHAPITPHLTLNWK